VPRISHKELPDAEEAEGSSAIRARVEITRQIQRERFAGSNPLCNAAMKPRQLRKFCALDEAVQQLMEMVTDRLGFSARTYTRLLKVARTIADLAEAIHCRSLDR
jgi:magnesium chelatase family protein